MTDEVHELLLNMKSCIDHLFGLSLLIRRLRARGKFRQLSSFRSSAIHQRDIVTVMDKFPKAKQTPWLAEKLGRATDQRRQFFMYRQEHRRRLGNMSKAKGSSGGDDITLETATTIATTFEEGADYSPSQPRQSSPKSAGLQTDRRSIVTAATSFVSDFDSSGEMGRHIPELREMILDGVQLDYDEPAECPYCRTIQTFTNRLSWK